MPKKFDVVIPAYGNKPMIAACIDSVRAKSGDDYRIILIDNRLWDFPPEYRIAHNVDYIPQRENIGYTKAANAGIALSTAPYVVLLNTDTEILTDGWLEKMASAFERVPKLAAVNPRADTMRWPSGRLPPDNGPVVMPQYPIPHGTGWDCRLSFFCVMLSREALLDIGYLDDRFSPGCGEDDDWLLRAHLRGWKVAAQTDVTVKHIGQASWNREERAAIASRNVLYLKEKHRAHVHPNVLPVEEIGA